MEQVFAILSNMIRRSVGYWGPIISFTTYECGWSGRLRKLLLKLV